MTKKYFNLMFIIQTTGPSRTDARHYLQMAADRRRCQHQRHANTSMICVVTRSVFLLKERRRSDRFRSPDTYEHAAYMRPVLRRHIEIDTNARQCHSPRQDHGPIATQYVTDRTASPFATVRSLSHLVCNDHFAPSIVNMRVPAPITRSVSTLTRP